MLVYGNSRNCRGQSQAKNCSLGYMNVRECRSEVLQKILLEFDYQFVVYWMCEQNPESKKSRFCFWNLELHTNYEADMVTVWDWKPHFATDKK